MKAIPQQQQQEFFLVTLQGYGIAWGQNVSFVQTFVWVFYFHSPGMVADGHRTVSDGLEAAFGGRFAAGQHRQKKII